MGVDIYRDRQKHGIESIVDTHYIIDLKNNK